MTNMSETEQELVAEGQAVETIGYSDNYGRDPLPERVTNWVRRWEPRKEAVCRIANEAHPQWEVKASTGSRDGRLLFVYLRRENGQRYVGGLFTVPYLADEAELTRLIWAHRPDDYERWCEETGATAVTWAPGHEEQR